MTIFKAIILGIIQGVAEFLPISSSAHLIIFPYLFGWEESSLAFDVALHFGTMMAVLVVFFKDLDMEGVSNKEELEKVVEEEIKAQKEREADNKFIEDLLEKASKNMKVEIDEEIIDAETDRMYKNFIEKLKMQGVTEELYFAYSGAKKEDIMKDMKKEAAKRVEYRYLLEAIVKAEEIKISDKDAKAEVKKMADMYKITEEEIMKELGSLEVVKYDLAMQKAVELLKENN